MLAFVLLNAQTGLSLSVWQYQETANETAYSCPSPHEGCNPLLMYDDNWDTGCGTSNVVTDSNCTAYTNFTKPSASEGFTFSNASLWREKNDALGTANYTIFNGCWNNSINSSKLMFKAKSWCYSYGSVQVSIWCSNGTDWITFGSGNNIKIYEDAMYWLFETSNGWYRLKAYDEEDSSTLVFNVTFSNTTNTTVYGNQTELFTHYKNVPQGQNTLTFMNYSGSGYVARTRIETIGNITGEKNITGYLLKTSSATMINFIIVNSLGSSISGALVTVQKLIGSEWVTVTQQLTDETGTAGIYMKDTTQYKIIVTKAGYQSMTTTITPTNPPYRITLSSSGVGTYQTDWSWITYMIEPYRGLYTNTTEPITLTITDERSSLLLYGLNITYNGSVVFSQEETSSPGGGQIFGSVNLTNASAYQIVYVTMWFQRVGYSLQTYTKTYVVFSPPGNAYTFAWSMNQLGAQFDPFQKAFIAIIVTFVIMVAIALVFPSLPKEGIAYAGLGILAIFTYLTWFNLVWLIVLGFITLGLKVMGGRL